MKSDFLSAPFLRLPKTITAILITKWMKKRWGSFRLLQYLSEILSTFSLDFGDRHLCLGRPKCQINRLEKSQKLKWVSALQTPSRESDFYQPSIPLTFNPFFVFPAQILCLPVSSGHWTDSNCIHSSSMSMHKHPENPFFFLGNFLYTCLIQLPSTTTSTPLRQMMLNLEFAMIQDSDT